MKEIKAYLTDDGKLFKSKDEAKTHEYKAGFADFVIKNTSLRGESVDNLISFLCWYGNEIIELIKDHPFYEKDKIVVEQTIETSPLLNSEFEFDCEWDDRIKMQIKND